MDNQIVFDQASFAPLEKKEKDLGTVYHYSLWKSIGKEIRSNPMAVFACAFLAVIGVVSVTVGPTGPQQFKFLAGRDRDSQP